MDNTIAGIPVIDSSLGNHSPIEHRGVIQSVEGNTALVMIEQVAACSSCYAREACAVAEKKSKLLEIEDVAGRFKVDDKVIVSVNGSSGYFAVITVFAVPLALVVIALTVVLTVSRSEATGAIAGLLVLLPYYAALYVFREKIKKKIVFKLSEDTNI
ncbi:MAG: SoxR reducing system RseC family protein [Tannerella sp.]|jgi:sigma-E factor negative regulatory protein RseC|nr:SoxR reducing system RseC family protein [Tannerella sp.]